MTDPGLPHQLMIIRHGEKPAENGSGPHGVTIDGDQDMHSLVVSGWQRAGALALLLTEQPSRARLGVPGRLLCPDYGEPTRHHRAYETLLPLSLRLGLAIEPTGAPNNPVVAARAAMTSPVSVVLICWDHNNISTLADNLPCAPATPHPTTWDDNRYDLVWVFELDADLTYRFRVVHQSLLAGDAPFEIDPP